MDKATEGNFRGGIQLKALVVYDTQHGNTEKIALAVAAGLKEAGWEAAAKKAEDATEADLKAAELWVFGSPVHIGGATGTAKKAVKLAVAAGAAGKKVATFDTRFANADGRGAAEKMGETLTEAGAKVVAPPQWFVVVKTKGPLAEGEEAKAVELGKKIAAGAGGK